MVTLRRHGTMGVGREAPVFSVCRCRFAAVPRMMRMRDQGGARERRLPLPHHPRGSLYPRDACYRYYSCVAYLPDRMCEYAYVYERGCPSTCVVTVARRATPQKRKRSACCARDRARRCAWPGRRNRWVLLGCRSLSCFMPPHALYLAGCLLVSLTCSFSPGKCVAYLALLSSWTNV